MIRNLCVAALVAATLVTNTASALAAPPTTDPPAAAAYGARWLASKVTPGGWVADPNGDPSPGATVSTALALASARVERDTFDRSMGWLAAHVDDYVVVGAADSPGNLGYLLLLVDAAGLDPTSFGGSNLVTRLQGTLGAREPGLFGVADPTYDGAFRQSLAILGLGSAGVPVPVVAVSWLTDQQCGAPSAAVGGWQAYRADTAQPCSAPDPVNYTGPDTNSTALATEALAMLGVSPSHDPVAFFEGAQDATGGFAYVTGGQVDPNSTALVIQALRAVGEDPAQGVWAIAGGSPYESLLSWQLGCSAPPADVGAFASPFSGGAPDAYSTQQAVWGASGNAFPLGRVDFVAAPTPCAVESTPPAPPASQPPVVTVTTATLIATTGTVRVASVAMVAAPAFTG